MMMMICEFVYMCGTIVQQRYSSGMFFFHDKFNLGSVFNEKVHYGYKQVYWFNSF